ncbi:MAG: thioredoxin family protein [bacterium]|nr:thioredoxin family protein [bacterium]
MKKLSIFMIMIAICLVTGCSKSYLKEISYKEYQQLLENKETFILEVMRDDCSACQTFKPNLEKVANEYKVEVKYLNISKLSNEELDKLGVSSTPTVIFYINGEEQTTAARIVGSVKQEKIISKLKASGFIE